MSYLSDKMRVEMSLPVHIMLAVLVCGANCASPSSYPENGSQIAMERWNAAWDRFNARIKTDEQFARSHETFQRTKALLVQACEEALTGIFPPAKEQSLLRRIERTHSEMVEPYLVGENPDPRKIGIIAFYLLQHLVDTRMLVVPEDSAFGQALEIMLPALSPWEGSTAQEIEDYDRLNRSAEKQARKVLMHLQAEGYYLGIPLPAYAA